MADFAFPRSPRRGDVKAALVVQKNLEDFMRAAIPTHQYYAPMIPRDDDPLAHLVVDKNMVDAVKLVLTEDKLPFFFPYVIRRDDPLNGALILQKNLEALVAKV
jgi:hypothetical protein